MPDVTVKFEGARFIITMDPQRRIIADGSLIVQGQRILQVGKKDELAAVPAGRVIDATDMVITPGFRNVHMRSEEPRGGKECRSRWSPYP